MNKLIKGINYGKFIHVKIQYDKKEMEIQCSVKNMKKKIIALSIF